jgi:hypothetical protein
MAATTLPLPETSPEMDELPASWCAICGPTPHTDDLHAAIVELRQWLRRDLQRRLVRPPAPKQFRRRASTIANQPLCVPRCAKML